MDSHLILNSVYIFIIVCMALTCWTLIKKVNTQTNTLIEILNSFSNIKSEIKLVKTKLVENEKINEGKETRQREIITSILNNVIDRVEKLEKSSNSRLEKVDRDVNKLYMHCSRKIERESLDTE